MAVAIDASGNVHLDDEAQEIYETIEEQELTYGDLEEE